MLFIAVLALLVFGPRKLPEVGRTLGSAMAQFRKASAELRMTVDAEVRELERHTRAAKEEAHRIGQEALQGVVPAGLPSSSDFSLLDGEDPSHPPAAPTPTDSPGAAPTPASPDDPTHPA